MEITGTENIKKIEPFAKRDRAGENAFFLYKSL